MTVGYFHLFHQDKKKKTSQNVSKGQVMNIFILFLNGTGGPTNLAAKTGIRQTVICAVKNIVQLIARRFLF